VLVVFLLATFGTLASAQSDKAPKYRIVDLGHLPGGLASDAKAINQSGQIAGFDTFSYQNGAIFAGRAFLYDDGQMVDLGTLGGLLRVLLESMCMDMW
jgi:probable HAF family extracellular repeat protein